MTKQKEGFVSWVEKPKTEPKAKTLLERMVEILEAVEKREVERLARISKSLELIKEHKPIMDKRVTK